MNLRVGFPVGAPLSTLELLEVAQRCFGSAHLCHLIGHAVGNDVPLVPASGGNRLDHMQLFSLDSEAKPLYIECHLPASLELKMFETSSVGEEEDFSAEVAKLADAPS
jgi:hypothetical protein